MLLAAAATAAALALVPGQTTPPTPVPVPPLPVPTTVLPTTIVVPDPIDDGVVLIPGTTINVCLYADLAALGELRTAAELALTAAGVEFDALRDECDNDDGDDDVTATATAEPTTSAPATTPAGDGGADDDGDDSDDDGDTRIVIPVGAPETGQPAATPPDGGLAALLLLLGALVGGAGHAGRLLGRTRR